MKQLFYAILCILFSSPLFAQLPNGSIAPDWTVDDIEGNTYNLYDILASGKSVIVDVSATWCGPCWNYHNTGPLHDVMEMYGPDGSDELMVFFVEGDVATTLADLQGTGSNTKGNWVAGTNYPILDQAVIKNMLQVSGYPTVMMICPDRKVKRLPTGLSAEAIHSQVTDCPPIEYAPEPAFRATIRRGCESLDVSFIDNSWPRAETYAWDFGDGGTSSDAEPTHTYDSPGNYTVKLTTTNQYGTTELTEDNYIQVGVDGEYATKAVGAVNKDIGTGRYFEGGHQGLVFDVMDDMILEEVTVFSNKAANRTVVVWDAAGNILHSKIVFIDEGEHTISLDFDIAAGVDYQIGLHSDAFLFRNDGGVTYPYEIEDMVSIKTSTAGTTPFGYYYYFYDWQVRPAACKGDNASVENIPTEFVSIFPNPVRDVLTIDVTLPRADQMKVTAFNALGQQVYSAPAVYTNHTISTTTWAEGTYTIQLVADGQLHTERVMVVK